MIFHLCQFNLRSIGSENKISISIYALNKKTKGVKCIRYPITKYEKRAMLLMLKKSHVPPEKRYEGMPALHFCSIVDPNRFFRVRRNNKSVYCSYCSAAFKDPNHIEKCLHNKTTQFKLSDENRFKLTELDRCINPPRMFVCDWLYANGSKSTLEIKPYIIGFTLVGINGGRDIDFEHTYIEKML